MGEKIKNILLSLICVACGAFFAMNKADSLFVVGFIPVPGWLLAAGMIILGLAVLIMALSSKSK